MTKIDVKKSFYTIDWPMMSAASLVLFFFVYDDLSITRGEGVILFLLLIIFLVFLLKFQKQAVVDEIPEDDEILSDYQTLLFFLIGAVSLWGGSEVLILGATKLALEFGVSERLIGITIISVGTSIPELAASVIAILKKMRVELDDFKINTIASLTDEHPRYYNEVTVEYHFFGTDLDKDKIEKSVDLSVTRYCGVMEMFRGFSKVKIEIKYN